MASSPEGRRPAQFDVIVLGAGINGSAIARDAAMRGLTVLLIEKDDISHATSAWNSRMIHGGLRYLEHYEFDLVRESLREREWLLHAAPHLVKPLPFMMPFLQRNKRPPMLLRMGMLAYDVLSYDKSLPHFRLFGKKRTLAKAPGLDPTQLKGGALFYDAQVDFAERLSVENVLSAREHGAQALTHAKATRLLIEGRRVVGVEYVDQLSGETSSARAKVTVNATGPWADELLEGLPAHDRPLIGGTKGTHLVVDPFPGAPQDCAMYYEAASDGRPVLVIPWQGRFLIGSTDIRYHGDAGEATADQSEIEYILSETNLLMPSARLTPDSVRFVYTGVRPLPFDPKDDPAKITRHHIVKDHAPAVEGLVTIVGGKLTTFRSLGQDATDRIVRKLGGRKRRSLTRKEALPGGQTADYAAFAASFKASVDVGERTADRLLSLYGVRAPQVIALAREEKGLERVFDERSGALAAELVYGLRTESARTLTDVIMRRTMLGLDPDLPIKSVEAAAAIMAEHQGRERGRAAKEVDAYVRYAARFRLR
ncbi:MAG: glycerol-3-phosphate dehydrogenase [Candidatus Limnocylindrales bacterium]